MFTVSWLFFFLLCTDSSVYSAWWKSGCSGVLDPGFCFSLYYLGHAFPMCCGLGSPSQGVTWSADSQCDWFYSGLSHGWFHFIAPLACCSTSLSWIACGLVWRMLLNSPKNKKNYWDFGKASMSVEFLSINGTAKARSCNLLKAYDFYPHSYLFDLYMKVADWSSLILVKSKTKSI